MLSHRPGEGSGMSHLPSVILTYAISLLSLLIASHKHFGRIASLIILISKQQSERRLMHNGTFLIMVVHLLDWAVAMPARRATARITAMPIEMCLCPIFVIKSLDLVMGFIF